MEISLTARTVDLKEAGLRGDALQAYGTLVLLGGHGFLTRTVSRTKRLKVSEVLEKIFITLQAGVVSYALTSLHSTPH